MIKRYIGFYDITGGEWGEYEYSDGYEDGIEDVLLREIRKRGGLMSLMEPVEPSSHWVGYSRVVITIGPEEGKRNIHYPNGVQCARLVTTCVECESINIEASGGSYSRGIVDIYCVDCKHEWEEPECPKILAASSARQGGE